jgi:predicted DsbA family dithiol-disulfide isomerase
MNKKIIIEYYSDVLCVWAWISQRRIDELVQKLGSQIEVHYHYVDVFGDVPSKMNSQWQEKGGYEGFAKHIVETTAKFESCEVNPKIWNDVRPQSSANVHLVLKAIELAYEKNTSSEFALVFRKAFFIDALDIGKQEILYDLIKAKGLALDKVSMHIENGSAMAALMGDYQSAKQQGIKGSPSYVLDGGHQILYGNVGYRVVQANVEELLKSPENEASWC